METHKIAVAVSAAIKQKYGLELAAEVSFAEPKFGDFATNAAFQLAGQLKRSPQEIAAELAKEIKDPAIAKAEPAGGFINLTVSEPALIGELANITADYGADDLGRGQKVQVEFISANPTGPLTLGNARGGFLGDAVAHVLAKSGYKVTREYYFNDAGSQIAKLVESVKAAGGLDAEAEYKGDYIDELAAEFKSQLPDEDAKELGRKLTKAIFERHIRPAIERAGISFDEWFNESSLVESGEFAAAVERLKQAGLFEEKDAAQWVKTSSLGDERDRPIVKSNGDVTYLGTDIAYHLNIFEKRGFARAIKVWGADHAGQVPSLKLTIKQLVPKADLEFIIVQFVRLVKDGKEYKISKRAGTYVTVDELIEEVASPDVARFFFLMRSADSHMDFDLDLAKEHGQKNPFWYLMYSNARAHSILTQAKNKRLKAAEHINSLNAEERKLVVLMTRLPQLVAETAADYKVQRLAHYGLEVAKAFHDWYEGERIIDLEPAAAGEKLYLVERYVDFMKAYCSLLGLTPLDKM